MEHPPPPPPADQPTPPPMGRARPGVVTAAAVLMFIGGGLGVLAGLLALGGGGMLGGSFAGGTLVVLGLVFLAVGAVQIYAGVKILNLQERGRILGIAIAAIGILLSLPQVGDAAGSTVLQLAINGFIIWALWSNAEVFHR